MTREEEINRAAVFNWPYYGYSGFIKGANWADSHLNTAVLNYFQDKLVEANFRITQNMNPFNIEEELNKFKEVLNIINED